MFYVTIILVLLHSMKCEQNYPIEDIPIEHFEQTDFQEDAMDFELIPRLGKSYFNGADYKILGEGVFQDIMRSKRDVKSPDAVSKKSVDSILIGLGKPLEVAVIGPENLTLKEDTVTMSSEALDSEDNEIAVNDFIRFRRSSNTDDMKTEVNEKDKETLQEKSDLTMAASKPLDKQPVEIIADHQKLMVSWDGPGSGSTREARGATKEQWAKQPYTVRRSDDYEDNYQSSSDSYRVPRVHFVTQKREEKYDREARARSLNTDLDRKLARDMSAEMDAYRPRYTRPWRYDERYDPYYYNSHPREARDPYRYDRSRDFAERPRDMYDDYRRPERKQRRIIYYATLPDIPRKPINMDSRDGYDHRSRYDDRYPPHDSYRIRGGYVKPRYEENLVRTDKSSYPVKVTTDLSVREVKKNPERRIYSDVNRSRYAQNAPYQPERM